MRPPALKVSGALLLGALLLSAHARESKQLSAIKDDPVYFRNTKDTSKWPGIIRKGIDEARSYFGNYGPVHVYILGHEDKALNSDEFHQKFVSDYCGCRHDRTSKNFKSCQDRMDTEFLKKVESGRGDAYLSLVGHTDPPLAELVFINPHQFHDPYLHTRGIHEYTHVFQRSFPDTPTWMLEGGAEFYACFLGEKRKWADLRKDMSKFMKNVHRVEDPKLGIEHMEDIDEVEADLRKYYRHLAYDAGAWAFAFMIAHSESKSAKAMVTSFYPLVAKVGWETALAQYTGMKDKAEFYEKFRTFLKEPLKEQLALLDQIKE